MAEEDRVDISEEVNPPVPAHSQPPPTHAPPPPTPAGILPAYSGAPPTHLPPPTSSGARLPRVSLTSSASDDQARMTALEGTVNQLAASMTANMAELFALLRGPNRASSSSTPPPGQRPTIDPIPWIPPAQVQENTDAPAPPTLHTSTVHPFTSPFPPPPAPTAIPLPPATFLPSEQAPSAPPPISIPAPAAVYTATPPMVFPASSAPAPTHLQAAELPPYPSLQPHVGLSYQAPPPINTTFLEPGTPNHAAQFASPTHFLPKDDAEQERRLKRIEETIRALQARETRPHASYGDCSLFPSMRLPSKFKIPEFKTYEGTTDPRHHLRHYRGKMLQYWEYEEFVIHSFQDSLSGSALDWFMGVYYSHLLAHTSSFSDLIEAGKKLDLGIKLDRMEGPTGKGEESSKKVPAMTSSSSERRGKEVSVNAVNPAHPTPQQYSMNLTTAPTAAPAYFPPPPQHQPQLVYYSAPPVPPPMTSQPFVHHYAPAPTPPRPPVSKALPPAQQSPTSQGPQAGGTQYRSCKQYTPLPAPLSHIYR
ncbi:hypothetical protein CRG98_007152 [Punica granatum]|uniref:Extensin-like n=1 Tax=Punica granatum TaxID=22663 RepID=A0A2I0KVF1_PUNGR|nr:hypothetical protein CRG98_007152 [Punica granatum]